jgi:tubulin polyglutamylase TTLL5
MLTIHFPHSISSCWLSCPSEDTPQTNALFPFLPLNFDTTPSIPSVSITDSDSPKDSKESKDSKDDDYEHRPPLYWNLLWTWRKAQIDLSKLFVWQKVNHFPDSKALTRKDLLKKSIEKLSKHRTFKYKKQWDIIPASYVLPQDFQEFVEAFSAGHIATERANSLLTMNQYNINVDPNFPHSLFNYWICKPPSLSRGRGIYITDSLSEIDAKGPLLVQKYITNPLLLEGYKFDLRLYVLVTSVQPLEVFLYKEGFARISTEKFSIDPESIKDRFVHLTNSSVQMQRFSKDSMEIITENEMSNVTSFPVTFRDPLGEGGSKISLSHLWRLLEKQGISTRTLWNRIKKLVVLTLVAVEEEIEAHPNAFELFGFDVLFTEDLQAVLIEVNASPSMGLDTPLDLVIKPDMLRDVIELVDPLPFDRMMMEKALYNKLLHGKFESNKVRSKNREERTFFENELISLILMGRKPRFVGEMPKKIGNFERLAPKSELYENAIKMKRSAFGPSSQPSQKFKRSLPEIA